MKQESLFEYPEPQYEEIDLDLLPPNEDLAGEEPDAAFIASVERRGVHTPILVTRKTKGKGYLVNAGRRRVKTARLVGLKKIGAMVYPKGFKAGDVITLSENSERKPNPVSEYIAIKNLMGQNLTEKQISEESGIPIMTIRKRLKLARLSEKLEAKLLNGEIAVTVAEAAVKLTKEDQNRLAQQEKITGADVDQMRRAKAVELPSFLVDTPGAHQAGNKLTQLRTLLREWLEWYSSNEENLNPPPVDETIKAIGVHNEQESA